MALHRIAHLWKGYCLLMMHGGSCGSLLVCIDRVIAKFDISRRMGRGSDYGAAFFHQKSKSLLGVLSSAVINTKRSKPTISILKFNIDAAPFHEHNAMGWVAVVRDDSGNFIRCITGHVPYLMIPTFAKIFVVCEALSWL
ncbi:hypothetical protein Goarm_017022 [Gossypium armourianum]|uniref:RNase H type-1 domain-containing protein n=1 Tax=Gossypium armourianum TaxID=34283 RepID=A0A7J9JE28_9ROSI|nr:hypothetical protein [Gossypium armourianum]